MQRAPRGQVEEDMVLQSCIFYTNKSQMNILPSVKFLWQGTSHCFSPSWLSAEMPLTRWGHTGSDLPRTLYVLRWRKSKYIIMINRLKNGKEGSILIYLLISLKDSVPRFITHEIISTRLSSAVYDNCMKYFSSETSLELCSRAVIRRESPTTWETGCRGVSSLWSSTALLQSVL